MTVYDSKSWNNSKTNNFFNANFINVFFELIIVNYERLRKKFFFAQIRFFKFYGCNGKLIAHI
jgi:hypothetical protein